MTLMFINFHPVTYTAHLFVAGVVDSFLCVVMI